MYLSICRLRGAAVCLAGLSAVGALALAGCGGSNSATHSTVAQSVGAFGSSSGVGGTTGSSGSGPAGGVTGQKGKTAGSAAQSGGSSSAQSEAAVTPGGGTTADGGKGHSENRTKSGHGTHAGRRSRGSTGGSPQASGSSGGPVSSAEDGVPFEIKNAAMQPTYRPFTRIYYDPTQTHPQIGQAVVFYFPIGVESGRCGGGNIGGQACQVAVPELTKILSVSRVVGLPGDKIAIQNGHVVRNGQSISEPGVEECGAKQPALEPGCQYPKPITVPAGSYYMVSDYRQLYQDDSRNFGGVSQAAIVGTVLGS